MPRRYNIPLVTSITINQAKNIASRNLENFFRRRTIDFYNVCRKMSLFYNNYFLDCGLFNRIDSIYTNQISSLKEQEAAFKEALPEIQALRHDTGVKPTIKFYSGADGIKDILDDIIETKRHISSLTSMEDAVALLSENFRDFIERRYTRHLKVRFLTNKSPETIALKKRDAQELRYTKFLPDNFKLKNANFIYGDKVAIISLNKKLPVGIIIDRASRWRHLEIYDEQINHHSVLFLEEVIRRAPFVATRASNIA